jgi:YrbI family 3-deoxy-D-manno-octulosonate 8-phosphate phosphatase
MSFKLLIFDVDGTLTDGAIFYGDNNLELKAFNARDGAALKPLAKLGVGVVFITGRESGGYLLHNTRFPRRSIVDLYQFMFGDSYSGFHIFNDAA